MKKFLIIGSLLVVAIAAATGGAISDRIFGYSLLDKYWPKRTDQATSSKSQISVLNEENVVSDVVSKVSSSVVTVSIKQAARRQIMFDPFNMMQEPDVPTTPKQQDIGSGFILDKDGLIVTNKHVVEDTTGTYQVVTSDDKTYDVQKIYRDPANDLAILKINAANLKPVELGDSAKIKVGQLAIAIGTALGEFRSTVTTGVISGLGRGISAGSPFEGSVEQLDNVIQTDAAINPGNSGGPLLNSAGQVIGINTAVSQQGQNIGFAIPINVIKEAIANFNQTGQFNRPYLGVRYRILDQNTALMNDVPQGAYVQEVITDSPAAKAGVEQGDIITKIDGAKMTGSDNALATAVAKHKVGDKINLEIWRVPADCNQPITSQNSPACPGQTKSFTATLEEAK